MDGNYSLADIAAATGGNRENDGMWGGDGAWWIIILFLFVFCGWGNNGWGNNGNGGGYAATAATQADIQRGFDNSAVISKLDGINNGLCDGFYAMNNGMLTGFNGINTNIMQTGFGIQQAINADTVANMQNTNALQSQLANCCCETREAIQGVNYNMAQNTCALQNTMNSNTRDIIDSQNAGTRAILDYLCNEKISSHTITLSSTFTVITAIAITHLIKDSVIVFHLFVPVLRILDIFIHINQFVCHFQVSGGQPTISDFGQFVFDSCA